MRQRSRLPLNHNIINLVVDKLQHEPPSIGRRELKVPIPLPIQRRRPRRQPIELTSNGLSGPCINSGRTPTKR
jgi:hypothetical protein